VNLNSRIAEWLKEIKEKGTPVEVTSFFEELPIRVKVKLLDFDDKFLQWESNPKLTLAADYAGKLFFYFNDPNFGTKRLLEAPVTYYGKKMVETAFPTPSADPRFERELLRVTVSEKAPVKGSIIKEEELPVRVRDLSEEGVGIIVPKGKLKMGDELEVNLLVNGIPIKGKGKVVRIEPHSEGELAGIKFTSIDRSGKRTLCDYIIRRQREILNQIRLLTE